MCNDVFPNCQLRIESTSTDYNHTNKYKSRYGSAKKYTNKMIEGRPYIFHEVYDYLKTGVAWYVYL